MTSRPLWTQQAITEAVKGESSGNADIQGITIDSRDVSNGDLFVALSGPNFDGHDFVAQALAQGAAAALVHKRLDGVPADRLIVVDDTLRALEMLGEASRARTGARIIAVTGSCGKTSTKEALATAFRTGGAAVHASLKSFNNHWGVPLTLARMPEDTDFGVFEIGMNSPGEIRELVKMVRPHSAIITTIEPAHLEFFGTVEAIADAKAENFEGLEPGGSAILPADNACIGQLQDRARACQVTDIRTFGSAANADARAGRIRLGAKNSTVSANICGTEMAVKIGIPGAHWINNGLACLLAVELNGGDLAAAGLALANMQALPGRGASEMIALADGQFQLIDESYNANPASMVAALSILATAEPGRDGMKGRRIAVLGDMLELGPTSPELHAGLADPIRDGEFHAFLCGPQMATLRDALSGTGKVTWAPDSAHLAPQVAASVRANDVVLVKGSLGSRMALIIEALKQADGGKTAAKAGV